VSLAGTVLRAGRGKGLLEGGLSLALGPWLGRGLAKEAACFKGPGRAAGARAAVSFDVDFQADVRALEGLADLLEKLSLKASFACVGEWVARHPEPHRALVRAGHEIINHTLSHPDNEELDPDRHFHLLGPKELKEQVLGGHRLLEDLLEVRPAGFRAPHFGHQHTEAVYPLLTELGYLYSSSTLASRSSSWGWPHPLGQGLWEFPVTVCPRHPFSSFDTWHLVRKRPNRHRPGDLTRLLEEVIRTALEKDLPLAFYLDPRDVMGVDGAASGECRRALELLASASLPLTTLGGWARELEGKA